MARGFQHLGNEFKTIHMLRQILGSTQDHPQLTLANGDDCAAFKTQGVMLWSCDSQVENVHFRWQWSKPEQVGWKAITASVSDIFVKGGAPKFALINLGIPKRMQDSQLKGIYKGIRKAAKHYQLSIIGGNITQSRDCFINVSLLGQASDYTPTRKAAKQSDGIGILGWPGLARGGLEVLKHGLTRRSYPALVKQFLEPQIPHQLIQILVNKKLIHAAIDISDGLSADLQHIAQSSSIKIKIDNGSIPIHAQLKKAAAALKQDALQWCLGPSDDYLPLVSFKKKHAKLITTLSKQYNCPLFHIFRTTF